MSTIESILSTPPPRTVAEALAHWPERASSPSAPGDRREYRDWRDDVLYFLLPDRFSDGKETAANLLRADLRTPQGLAAVRAARPSPWNWSDWIKSGSERFQGGTLRGIASKLDYLRDLGITALWIAPVFRQRVEENSYHGYGIQDFFDVDPRFGTRRDLVDLVQAAHQRGMRVILDIIFNHSGCNWLYDHANSFEPPYLAPPARYPVLRPRSGMGHGLDPASTMFGNDDYVWPANLQGLENYVRAGKGDLGAGDLADPNAECRRTDFCSLRKFNLDRDDTLYALVLAYHYWIALADHDGYRIDTFKHVSFEQARGFANGIKEYAEDLGKDRFFLLAEVAGGDQTQSRYLQITGRNLDACLDIGEQRETLCRVSKGLQDPQAFFDGFNREEGMGSHRTWGSRHVSISNDHDHVFGLKVRLDADASNDHQAAVAMAMQLFGLGIPCIYYGTEQGLASGVEVQERQGLPWGTHDCLLREAMFGPSHPLSSGYAGTQGQRDTGLPGFGPHGTTGRHVFDPQHPLYQRIRAMTKVRETYRPLRRGRQYQRQTSVLGAPFSLPRAGELVAWSRLYDDQEVLVTVNPHGTEARGGRVIVDARLSTGGMKVVLCTDPANPVALGTVLPAGASDGCHWVDLPAIGASEVLVLANCNAVIAAGKTW